MTIQCPRNRIHNILHRLQGFRALEYTQSCTETSSKLSEQLQQLPGRVDSRSQGIQGFAAPLMFLLGSGEAGWRTVGRGTSGSPGTGPHSSITQTWPRACSQSLMSRPAVVKMTVIMLSGYEIIDQVMISESDVLSSACWHQNLHFSFQTKNPDREKNCLCLLWFTQNVHTKLIICYHSIILAFSSTA